MFAIVIELLANRYVATAYNDRERAEWPPHPARLFSALVATWGDGDPHGASGEAERAALEWLEQQAPPEILASDLERSAMRRVVPVFVPVNDVSQVAGVDSSKLVAAEAALASAKDAKARAKAQKEVDRLRAKHRADTAKAIAAPSKFGKEVDAGLKVLPEHRPKQARTFPCVIPADSRISFVWRDVVSPSAVRSALENLLSRVVRLGHSSSLVRCEATDEAIHTSGADFARYRPDDDGELVLRWVDPGQLARLCRAYDQHREIEPRVLPARFVRYTTHDEYSRTKLAHSLFANDFIVFARSHGPRLPITATAELARHFRRALMSFADEPIHEMISGHHADGSPSDSPHLAVVPLPVVTGPYPDGALIGIALVLPCDCPPDAKRAVLRAIGRFEQQYREDDDAGETPRLKLVLGRAGELYVRRVAWRETGWTLNSESWTRPARRWATATPIALDQNPGNLYDENPARRQDAFAAAAASIAESVRRIGLPEPQHVDVLRSCVLPGTAKPKHFPRFPSDPSRTQRVLVHARLMFSERVRGPLLLGAGRYHGLGLCAPVDPAMEGR